MELKFNFTVQFNNQSLQNFTDVYYKYCFLFLFGLHVEKIETNLFLYNIAHVLWSNLSVMLMDTCKNTASKKVFNLR